MDSTVRASADSIEERVDCTYVKRLGGSIDH